jgi:hypothetical protein
VELYIQIKNNEPFEHPILESNLLQVFPGIDLDNLPPEFARFKRVEAPLLGVYEVYEGLVYEWDNDIVKDVHVIRPMTVEEKTAKQEKVKARWAESPNWTSWSFNEESCSFQPPIPYPDDDKVYQWNEESVSWVEQETLFPEDLNNTEEL